MKFFIILLFCFTTISCSTVKKLLPNMFSGSSELSDDIQSKSIDTDITGSDSGTIEGLSTVYFQYNSFVLSVEAKQTLQQNIEWINSHSEVKNLELEGHCDSRGSEAYNIGLGRRRAQSVYNFLAEKGISKNRLSITSYGEERPLSNIEDGKNRRVNFVPIY